MKEERAIELLTKFHTNGIHKAGEGLQDVLEWQDIIGQASPKEIVIFESGLPQRMRELFVWVNFNTLSYDMALTILSATVVQRKVERELAPWVHALREKEQRIEKILKALLEIEKGGKNES